MRKLQFDSEYITEPGDPSKREKTVSITKDLLAFLITDQKGDPFKLNYDGWYGLGPKHHNPYMH